MYKGQKVSVILPTYNEEGSIYDSVRDFKRNKYVDEVLVVDNNAKGRSAELARRAGARVVKEPRQGYGWSCRRGLEDAKGDLLILAEPDGTFHAKDVDKLLPYTDDFDVVYGTRTNRSTILSGANMGLFLKWGNWVLAKIIEVLFNAPAALTDVGCTMRAMKRGSYDHLKNKFRIGASEWGPEMLMLTLKERTPIVQIPVSYGPRVGFSSVTGSKWKAFKLGLRMIWLILAMRFLR